MSNNKEILKTIDDENKVWLIYLILIGLCFYANDFEKKYFQENNLQAKEKYRELNILIFTIALIVYSYFFNSSYNDIKKLKPHDNHRKKFYNEINCLASVLILIAGTILLFIAVSDTELETEIAFS